MLVVLQHCVYLRARGWWLPRRKNSRELKASAPKITPCVIIQEQESLQVGSSADLTVFAG